jgi:DNA repair protein RadA/Sms
MMQEVGLVSSDESASLFISENRSSGVPGSALTVVMEGTRPIVVEVQALTNPTKLPFAKRVGQGIDSKRLELLLAILVSRCRLNLSEQDVYVNVVGGIKLRDTAADLAVAMAIASSYREKALPLNLVSFGEVGLMGEVRGVAGAESRAKQARRMGYRDIVSNKDFKRLQEALQKYLK